MATERELGDYELYTFLMGIIGACKEMDVKAKRELIQNIVAVHANKAHNMQTHNTVISATILLANHEILAVPLIAHPERSIAHVYDTNAIFIEIGRVFAEIIPELILASKLPIGDLYNIDPTISMQGTWDSGAIAGNTLSPLDNRIRDEMLDRYKEPNMFVNIYGNAGA